MFTASLFTILPAIAGAVVTAAVVYGAYQLANCYFRRINGLDCHLLG